MKMKDKQKIKKEPKFKQDRLFKWCESILDFIAVPILLFSIFSILSFFMFWGECVRGIATCEKLHNVNFIVTYLIIFIAIMELIYIWICKNERELKDDDVLPIKIISFFITSIIINVIVPIIYGIYYMLTRWFVQVTLGIFWTIIGSVVLYVFYKINQWILIKIRESRK